MTQTHTALSKINLSTAVFCTIFGDALEVIVTDKGAEVVGYDSFDLEDWGHIVDEAEWSDKYQAWMINW